MKPTQQLHEAGQSLWLDNITRGLLDRGTLEDYVAENAVTGLTSNPTIFDKAIEAGSDYDAEIASLTAIGMSEEEVFFELALTDLRRAADLFASVHQRSDGIDGWVSLEVSPLLDRDAGATIEEAKWLHAKGGKSNLFIKIPGTPEGLPAIEECTFLASIHRPTTWQCSESGGLHRQGSAGLVLTSSAAVGACEATGL